MTDFHSHILPGVDDGAKDIGSSLEMLRIQKSSGVNTVVLTPHCHPINQEKINSFLLRRQKAYDLLLTEASKEDLPHLVLASEIRIYRGFTKYAHLDKLLIEGTDYILLEMPYERWNEDTLEEVYKVTRLGFKPIMAHLDRFSDQSDFFPELSALGVFFQINTSAFLEKSERKHLSEFFKANRAHVLGSDTHNLTTRPPNLAEAYDIIEKKFGKDYSDFFKTNGKLILENKPPREANLPGLGFIKKMFL